MHHTRDERLNTSGTTATLESRVVPLKELKDYTVAKGDPDVRGWNVYSNDGRKVGEVEDLLVDTEAMKVRYLEVDLDQDLLSAVREAKDQAMGRGDQDHVLIPIGSAQLDVKDDRVVVDLLHTLVGGLPTYQRGALNRDYETSLRQRFDRDYQHHPDRDRDFYNHDLYNDDRFYAPRRRR